MITTIKDEIEGKQFKYQIVERGEELPIDLKDNYWTIVKRTLELVFREKDMSRAKTMRKDLDQRPPEEQTAFYHTDPFWVATHLAGRKQDSITADEKLRYVKDVKNVQSPPTEQQLGLAHPEQEP